MNLLPKKQLNVQIARERKAQIDEGISLATKIDKLRETLNNLELQQRQFLDGMQSELHNRTHSLIERIAEMEKDIVELENKRQELLKPLASEWTQVNMKSAEIDSIKAVLDKNLLKIAQKEEKMTLLGTEIKNRLSRIKIRERELDKVYDKAEQSGLETEQIKQEIASQKESQASYFEREKKKIESREQAVHLYEFTLSERKLQIEFKEKEIEAEKVRLLDQRGTLERAMARLNKK